MNPEMTNNARDAAILEHISLSAGLLSEKDPLKKADVERRVAELEQYLGMSTEEIALEAKRLLM